MTRTGAAAYHFLPEERPQGPGAPYTPPQSTPRRLGYLLTALLLGIVASLGNALVTVNLPNLAGSLGLYVAEVNWLPAVYVAMNASANLMLIKARAQFGIPAVTHGLLAAYVVAGVLQFIVPGFGAALLIRAVSGMAAAGLTTMVLYNVTQAAPLKYRPMALVFGIGLPQFGIPIARLFPVEMLALGHWQGLHLIEIALALAAFVALIILPLPPSERTPAFEPLDFVTIGLVIPAFILVCGVLSEGRFLWWTDTPWLGVALAAAIPLFVSAMVIEHNRARPLVRLEWIATRDIARFAVVALVIRIALAEQTYGSVGLLSFAGLTNDQLRALFGFVILMMVLGLGTAVATVAEKRLPYMILAAALIIALGAALDSHATSLTRPSQLFWSQGLIGYGTTLFIGPALIYGLQRLAERGGDHLITFIVLFSTTQNVGGLVGAAVLGSYQVAEARTHALALAERISLSDPQAAARFQSGAERLSGALADPGAQVSQGAGLIGQALTREATILAFNDVFSLVEALALLTAAYLAYIIAFNTLKRRRAAPIVAAA